MFTTTICNYPHMLIGRVWICRLLFVCLCVCMVMDFSAKDKASGVTFCLVVHQHPRQGITNFVNFAPQKPKIGRIGQRAGYTHSHVNITVEMRQRKRHAGDAPFVKLCGVWT